MRATPSVRTGCDTAIVLLAFLSACGRIGFDPIPSTNDGAADSALSDGRPIDALTTACATAMPVTVGVRMAVNTCTGKDLVDGCGPAGREEVVFDFIPPTTRSYNVRAYDTGTNTISASTGRVDSPCTGTTGCSGLLGTTFTAGQHYYFAYEGNTVACAAIEVLVD